MPCEQTYLTNTPVHRLPLHEKPPASVPETTGKAHDLPIFLIKIDGHGATANLTVIVHHARHFQQRWSRDLEAFETGRAGDSDHEHADVCHGFGGNASSTGKSLQRVYSSNCANHLPVFVLPKVCILQYFAYSLLNRDTNDTSPVI